VRLALDRRLFYLRAPGKGGSKVNGRRSPELRLRRGVDGPELDRAPVTHPATTEDAAEVRPRRRLLITLPRPGWRHLPYAILAFAVVVGGLLRTYRINAVGFNTDEAVYAGQAASIANDTDLIPYFPIFRAHPLLFQSMLSVPYQLGTSDVIGRLFVAAIGVATIVMLYKVGSLLYGPLAGAIAALIIALMPYHVVVSRQVLLDGPETFWATVTLFTLAKFAATRRLAWLYGTGAALGLTVLSKETAILFVAAVYAFLALTPEIAVKIRHAVIALGVMTLVILPFPLSVMIAGSSETGGNFLAWQLFRRPNHEWTFYPTVVPGAMGYLVVIAAIAGLWFLRGRRSWRETLLLCWIAVPVIFFQLWPVKGFQYLLPVAPAVALLAARPLAAVVSSQWELRVAARRFAAPTIGLGLVALVALSLLVPSAQRVQPSQSDTFLAGSGGVPGGREAGRWIGANIPEGSQLMTVGPSMANILQFYGHRRAFGLSVSPNPLHRNPVYTPLVNPDLSIRYNDLQYVVWDAFSADRSPFFERRLMRYVERYHGRAIHTQTVNSGGTLKPVIRIYEVRP